MEASRRGFIGMLAAAATTGPATVKEMAKSSFLKQGLQAGIGKASFIERAVNKSDVTSSDKWDLKHTADYILSMLKNDDPSKVSQTSREMTYDTNIASLKSVSNSQKTRMTRELFDRIELEKAFRSIYQKSALKYVPGISEESVILALQAMAKYDGSDDPSAECAPPSRIF